ncbi:MAG: flippase-like domain-containing protein [Deltaproteobacteria bacterium]|nr:flippase-like domain-containing protein [Deltaproteobacteria bacterium]
MNKRFLIFLYCGGVLLSGAYFYFFFKENPFAGAFVPQALGWHYILSASFLILAGEFVRIKNSQLLVGLIAPNRFDDLFRAYAFGSLFNVFMPFRTGELVRAHVLGRLLACSRTSILMTIIVERVADVLVLVLFLSAILAFNQVFFNITFLSSQAFYLLFAYLLAFFLAAVAVLYLMASQNRFVLRAIHKSTAVFNNSIRDRLRYALWGSICTVRLIFQKARLGRYVFQAVAMWLLYISGVFLAIRGFYAFAPSQTLFLSFSSFLCLAIPSGPGFLGTFNYYFLEILRSIPGAPAENSIVFTFFIWALLVLIPVTAGGILLLMYKRRRSLFDRSDLYLNKLMRYDNISSDLSHFLDEYFSQNMIFNIVTGFETDGASKVMMVFKGGSNAVTLLMCGPGKDKFVRKIALPQYEDKLRAQYQWLKSYDLPEFPKLLSSSTNERFYCYDLEFYGEYTPFFDYIHKNPLASSVKVLESILEFMSRKVYLNGRQKCCEKTISDYIFQKAVGKVRDVAAMSPALRRLVSFEQIEINGLRYDNFHTILQKIMDSKEMIDELSRFRECQIHGDLTVDNIIVSEGKFILLDPNDENTISDPVVDIAKLYQSLHSGYEFLCSIEDIRVDNDRVSFNEQISTRYQNLFQSLDRKMRRDLAPKEYRSIFFHEGVHYCRMLPYKARLNEKTLPLFYSIGVRLFNEYYAQCRDGKNSEEAEGLRWAH